VPLSLWRIAAEAPAYGADDLTGEGARLTGGRWNRIGTPMLYASTSRALACLETIVHLGAGGLPLNRYLVEIVVPDLLWTRRTVFDASRCVGWDAVPEGRTSLDWGASWQASAATLLAEVPSIVVPEEFNVLINPAHPDVAQISAAKVRRWTFDARLA
jgi:RES domain-containing protein